MKHARSLAIVLAALALPLFPQNIRAGGEVTFGYFQEALSPFGEWIEVGDYGLCWRPTGVPADWAPYTDGYWAYTDAGWTWVSYEDWGGITYHYGRWIHLLDEGWVWVPEYQWGPAWVSWRSNDDYVGWAPLPPEARWEEETGFSTWVDTSYDIGPDSYRFCHTRDFGAPVLAPICVPRWENVTIIQSTVNITNITFNSHNSLIFCGGPNFISINRHVHRPIPSMKLHCEDREVRGPHGNRAPQVVRGNQIALYAPKVKRPVDLKALPITPLRVVGADKLDRGWSRVPDLAAQQQIKQRLQKQSEGLDPRTAPARPVKPADLTGVPTKADPTARPPTTVVRDRSGPSRNAGRPSLPSLPSELKRPVAETKPVVQPTRPAVNPPAVAERVETPVNALPNVAQPVGARLPGNPPVPTGIRPPQSRPEPSRLPQVAVPDASSRVVEVERGREQRAQAQRQQAEVASRQQENPQRVQRANEVPQQAVQQQQAAQRANENRQQAVQQQQAAQRANENRQQAVQQQQAAQRANENRQQAVQQQQAAQRANENRQQAVQQQQAAQRANENRQQAVQQQQAAQRASENRQQAVQQQQAAQRANENRQQAVQQQQAAQRANENRQQQTRQAPPPQREYTPPPSRPVQQEQSRPAQAQRKDGEDDNKRQRSGR